MTRPIALFLLFVCLSPAAALAEELSEAAQEVWNRLPEDQRAGYADAYGFDLHAPIDVLELTSDVIGVLVSCNLYSSYMTDPETVVAEGSTLVIDQDTPAVSSVDFERVHGRSHWIMDDNFNLGYAYSRMPIPMLRVSEMPIESWTHGDCSLKILAWDGEGDGMENRRELDPIECEYGSVSDPWMISACHSNTLGFKLSSFAPFGRLGFDVNGRALD